MEILQPLAIIRTQAAAARSDVSLVCCCETGSRSSLLRFHRTSTSHQPKVHREEGRETSLLRGMSLREYVYVANFPELPTRAQHSRMCRRPSHRVGFPPQWALTATLFNRVKCPGDSPGTEKTEEQGDTNRQGAPLVSGGQTSPGTASRRKTNNLQGVGAQAHSSHSTTTAALPGFQFNAYWHQDWLIEVLNRPAGIIYMPLKQWHQESQCIAPEESMGSSFWTDVRTVTGCMHACMR